MSRVLGKTLGLWLFWEAKWKAKKRGAEKRSSWPVKHASGQSEAWGQEIMWPAISGAFEEWSESRLCLKQIGVMMFGVREKSLSFGEETNPWMTPKVVFPPLVQHQRSWQDFVWSWACLDHAYVQGNKKIRLVGVLPSLLSPEVNRLLLDSLAEGLPQEVCTSADWTLLWFDGLKKCNPQSKTTLFPNHIFHSAFLPGKHNLL